MLFSENYVYESDPVGAINESWSKHARPFPSHYITFYYGKFFYHLTQQTSRYNIIIIVKTVAIIWQSKVQSKVQTHFEKNKVVHMLAK